MARIRTRNLLLLLLLLLLEYAAGPTSGINAAGVAADCKLDTL